MTITTVCLRGTLSIVLTAALLTTVEPAAQAQVTFPLAKGFFEIDTGQTLGSVVFLQPVVTSRDDIDFDVVGFDETDLFKEPAAEVDPATGNVLNLSVTAMQTDGIIRNGDSCRPASGEQSCSFSRLDLTKTRCTIYSRTCVAGRGTLSCTLTSYDSQVITFVDPLGDQDDDGILDSVDNCPAIANADQTDTDSDGLGDACDADDDGDEIVDIADNCPLIPNAGQEDLDGDGAGDACDADIDGDGVRDDADACLLSPPGEVVDLSGCAVADLCPCDNGWKNHGAYVTCASKAAKSFVEQGLIAKAEKGAITSAAARSQCGKTE